MNAAYPWCWTQLHTTSPRHGGGQRHRTEAAKIHDIHQPPSSQIALDAVLREGARRLLQSAIEQEVAAYIDAHATELDEDGHRLVVRNGRAPARNLQTGVGPIPVSRPRVDDLRIDEDGNRLRFESGKRTAAVRGAQFPSPPSPWSMPPWTSNN